MMPDRSSDPQEDMKSSLANVWVRKASSADLCMGRKLTPRGRDLGALERTRPWMEVRGRHHFECVAIPFIY